MIGKQTKGTSFSGCVRYVLKEEKSKLLEAVGVNGSPEQMAEQFELQALLNDKVKNIVGHTSLNFSPEDGECLKSDDALMLQIAHDYMKLMGIENTQYIIARHIDREHPHCHIVFNRVDNDGKTISDKNDFRRNEKVCKMLTAKYRLHFANGKDHIKEERLRPYDKAKHEIYKALKEELPTAHSWDNLKDALADREIDMKFKVSRTTREIQGVKFEYNSVVGNMATAEELFEQGFDAIYVATGAGLPKFLNVPGENLPNVFFANEYLTRVNLMKANKFPEYDLSLIHI
mgnify:CR=1 FL=1